MYLSIFLKDRFISKINHCRQSEFNPMNDSVVWKPCIYCL